MFACCTVIGLLDLHSSQAPHNTLSSQSIYEKCSIFILQLLFHEGRRNRRNLLFSLTRGTVRSSDPSNTVRLERLWSKPGSMYEERLQLLCHITSITVLYIWESTWRIINGLGGGGITRLRSKESAEHTLPGGQDMAWPNDPSALPQRHIHTFTFHRFLSLRLRTKAEREGTLACSCNIYCCCQRGCLAASEHRNIATVLFTVFRTPTFSLLRAGSASAWQPGQSSCAASGTI